MALDVTILDSGIDGDIDGDRLDDATRERVVALVRAATDADGVAPLSEQSLLQLRHPGGARHLLASTDDGSQLLGYAQVVDGAGELVVDPESRRHGVGSRLLTTVLAAEDDVRLWAHGDLPGAAALARTHHLESVRELYLLERSLDEPVREVSLPEGFAARAFRPGRDEDEWVRVNAAAFAHHAEQGRMTRADLEERMAEPWFDPAGLLLVVERRALDTVVAFHWTKVHPAGERGPDPFGEVYVVGVDPSYQGRGLGRPLTLLGLHHLQDAGLRRVVLYVDGDNPAALTVYRSLGFTTLGVDRMYARRADEAVGR